MVSDELHIPYKDWPETSKRSLEQLFSAFVKDNPEFFPLVEGMVNLNEEGRRLEYANYIAIEDWSKNNTAIRGSAEWVGLQRTATQSIAAGGDYVEFDFETTNPARLGFSDYGNVPLTAVNFSKNAVYAFDLELEWDTYTGSFEVEFIRVRGGVELSAHPQPATLKATSGSVYRVNCHLPMASGDDLKIKITQSSGSAQTLLAASLLVSIPGRAYIPESPNAFVRSYTSDYEAVFSSTPSPLNVTLPICVDDDLLVLVVAINLSNTVETPSGWTAHGDTTSGAYIYYEAGNFSRVFVFTKVATAADSEASLNVVHAESSGNYMSYHCWSVAKADSIVSDGNNSDAAVTSWEAPSVDAPVAGGVLLTVHASLYDASSTASWSQDAAMTAGERQRVISTYSHDTLAAYEEGLLSGATGTRTATHPTGSSNLNSHVSVAILAYES